MVRAFAIAPTASCSYRSTDSDGFTATPEIAPRSVERLTEIVVPSGYKHMNTETLKSPPK